jgi:23S rRNA pseudouridine2605 synthase
MNEEIDGDEGADLLGGESPIDAESSADEILDPAGESPTPDMPPALERLAKFLAAAGVASRRECEEIIRLGRVTVNGEMVTEVGTKIEPERADVRVDEQRVRPEPKVYWWINKPRGVLSTSKDTHGRRTVIDLLPRTGKRLYCVGRLDEESTGLMLMTNDGEMALRLTHPRYGVPKTYVALVAGKVTPDVMAQMTKGVWLAEGKARVSHIKYLGSMGKASRLQIVLREGKNREIRRMFAKLGHKVMALHRTQIGPLKIRRVKPGEARPVAPEEIFELRKLARLVRGPATPGASQPPTKKAAAKRPRNPGRGRMEFTAEERPRAAPKRPPSKRPAIKKGRTRTAGGPPGRPKLGTRKGIKKSGGRQSDRRRGKNR